MGSQRRNCRPSLRPTYRLRIRNLLILLAQSGNWDDAAALGEELQQAGLLDDIAALAYSAGIVFSGLLVPDEYRRHLLEGNIFHKQLKPSEGEAAEAIRERALRAFGHAKRALREKTPELIDGVRAWRLWLQFSSRKIEYKEEAAAELQLVLAEPKTKILGAALAVRFDVDFDHASMLKEFEGFLEFGGLTEQQALALVHVAKARKGPAAFLSYVSQRRRELETVLPKNFLAHVLIEAHIENDDAQEAKRVLEESRSAFQAEEQERLRAIISELSGNGSEETFESLYSSSGSTADLNNLLNHLTAKGAWSAALPLFRELITRERTSHNALRLLRCTRQANPSRPEEIVNLYTELEDLLATEREAKSTLAWALFELGDLSGAEEINTPLFEEKTDAGGLYLAFNIISQTGNWNQLSDLTKPTLLAVDQVKTDFLLALASAVADTGTSAAMPSVSQLLKAAAEKSSQDAGSLVQCALLAFRLGLENSAVPQWLAQASALDEKKSIIVPLDPEVFAHQIAEDENRRLQDYSEMLLKGGTPIHLIERYGRFPLSRLLLEKPRLNRTQSDGRKVGIIPVCSGAQRPTAAGQLRKTSRIGLDITTVLVAYSVGALGSIFNYFEDLWIAPETLAFLLREIGSTKHHQKSQVERAKAICNLVESSIFRQTDDSRTGLPEITEAGGIGAELAELIAWAEEWDGIVVSDRTATRDPSGTIEIGDSSEYSSRVVGTAEFFRSLKQAGALFTDEQSTDGEVPGAEIDLRVPILLCSDAVDSLLSHQIENSPLPAMGFHLHVHPDVYSTARNLVDDSSRRDETVRDLQRLKALLQTALATESVRMLPQRQSQAKAEQQDIWQLLFTIPTLIEEVPALDVISIDDRYFNHVPMIEHENETAFVACCFDLLAAMRTTGGLSEEEHLIILQRAWSSGFVLPLIGNGLLSQLTSAATTSGCFTETAQLRALRQALARARELELLQLPTEVGFLSRLHVASLEQIRAVWSNEEISSRLAVDCSTWIWEYVRPLVADWVSGKLDLTPHAVYGSFATLFSPIESIGPLRARDFVNWCDTVALGEIAPNSGFFEGLAEYLWRLSRELAEEMTNDTSTSDEQALMVFGAWLDHLPGKLKNHAWQLMERLSGESAEKTWIISIGDHARLTYAMLFEVSRRSMGRSQGYEFRSIDGVRCMAVFDGYHLRVLYEGALAGEGEFRWMQITSASRRDRLRCFRELAATIDPSAPILEQLAAKIEQQVPTDSELETLYGEYLDSPLRWRKAAAESATGVGPKGLHLFPPEPARFFNRLWSDFVSSPELLPPDKFAPKGFQRDYADYLRRASFLAAYSDIEFALPKDDADVQRIVDSLVKYSLEWDPLATLAVSEAAAVWARCNVQFDEVTSIVSKMLLDEATKTPCLEIYSALSLLINYSLLRLSAEITGLSEDSRLRLWAWMHSSDLYNLLVSNSGSLADDTENFLRATLPKLEASHMLTVMHSSTNPIPLVDGEWLREHTLSILFRRHEPGSVPYGQISRHLPPEEQRAIPSVGPSSTERLNPDCDLRQHDDWKLAGSQLRPEDAVLGMCQWK